MIEHSFLRSVSNHCANFLSLSSFVVFPSSQLAFVSVLVERQLSNTSFHLCYNNVLQSSSFFFSTLYLHCPLGKPVSKVLQIDSCEGLSKFNISFLGAPYFSGLHFKNGLLDLSLKLSILRLDGIHLHDSLPFDLLEFVMLPCVKCSFKVSSISPEYLYCQVFENFVSVIETVVPPVLEVFGHLLKCICRGWLLTPISKVLINGLLCISLQVQGTKR
jgi:hypothetical protein